MVDSNWSRNQSFLNLWSEHELILEQFSLQHLWKMVSDDELMDEPIELVEEVFLSHRLPLVAEDYANSSRLEFPKLLDTLRIKNKKNV